MKKLFILFLCLCFLRAEAQYNSSNAHSHNDYLQVLPFRLAYKQEFGSVEADLFLKNDSLFVAHEYREIRPESTFETLYLYPLLEVCRSNNGSIYPDKTRSLQLLLDLKTGHASALPALIRLLEPYRKYFYPEGTVKVVISGHTPEPENFVGYPEYIFFDGRPEISYTDKQLEKIGLISQSFRNYSRWDGRITPGEEERQLLAAVVQKVHAQGKPVRFWASPDLPDAWKFLMSIGVDYINTDKVQELGKYLSGTH